MHQYYEFVSQEASSLPMHLYDCLPASGPVGTVLISRGIAEARYLERREYTPGMTYSLSHVLFHNVSCEPQPLAATLVVRGAERKPRSLVLSELPLNFPTHAAVRRPLTGHEVRLRLLKLADIIGTEPSATETQVDG